MSYLNNSTQENQQVISGRRNNPVPFTFTNTIEDNTSPHEDRRKVS